jgi:hypothetical protein
LYTDSQSAGTVTEVADPEPKHFVGVRRSSIVNKSITGVNHLADKGLFFLEKELLIFIRTGNQSAEALICLNVTYATVAKS